MTRMNGLHSTPSGPLAPVPELARAEASVRAEVVNPTIDWDTDQARAERYLRRFPHTAAMSEREIARAAEQAVRRRCQARQEIKHE
jgi:hypothetical protein